MKAHGIMFHHFHDGTKHIKGQGSISANELEQLLDFYGTMFHIISAPEFMEKALQEKLEENEVCITFDDGLLCQYDVAFPILEKRGLKAFWFVYTSPMVGSLEKIEIYRHFRFSKFLNIEEFYTAFFEKAIKEQNRIGCDIEEVLSNFDPNEYAKAFTFYTSNDKRFRYLRNDILGEEKYNFLMDKMIEEKEYNVLQNAALLWMKDEQLKHIYSNGHIIGLHSHTHPTVLSNLTYESQKREYEENQQILESKINVKIQTVSYPCNSYNDDTFKILDKMGIKLGFRANMDDYQGKMLLPREDHSNIMRVMRERGNENNDFYK